MATAFSTIYDAALVKFSDYNMLVINEDVRDEILHKYLISAQFDFKRVCKSNLSDINQTNKEYNADLSEDEIDILALGVAYYWTSAQLLNSDLMQNLLSTRDYTYHSNAELIKVMSAVKESLRSEFKKRIIWYSFNNSDLSTLGV